MSLTQIKGGADLKKALETLAPNLERNVMRAAMRQGANEILKAARANVPVDKGTLKKTLRVSTKAKRGVVTATLIAGGKFNVFYAHMVEYGTAPHAVGSGSNISSNKQSGRMHPGAIAQPFMRPAIDENLQAAVDRTAVKIREVLASKHGVNVPVPEQVIT